MCEWQKIMKCVNMLDVVLGNVLKVTVETRLRCCKVLVEQKSWRHVLIRRRWQ